MLTALLPLAAFLTASPAPLDAPSLAAHAFADAQRVLAVHQLPGAVVFDLDRAGERFQLTISLDDDGAVVATAIDWTGPADPDGGVGPGRAARLDRIDRIDVTSDGAAVVVRGGATSARFAIAASR